MGDWLMLAYTASGQQVGYGPYVDANFAVAWASELSKVHGPMAVKVIPRPAHRRTNDAARG